ncbi:Hypothetical predicted protein [Lecanosticta acicola]|uniref:Rhodopsin domain-containing protein n=1 Tax=Lecanosticta acicola TaxID=111012 RepID=A0AAI8YYQ8_9PEZI|nr:Hypothetical predicted protein [Lecanosticta acicola]
MYRISMPNVNDLTKLPPAEKERLIHESRGPMVLGVAFSFYGLSVILVATRIYVRTKISRQAKIDDWIILGTEVSRTAVVSGLGYAELLTRYAFCAEQVICTAMMVFVYYQIYYGDGRHLQALTTFDVDNIAKVQPAFEAVTCSIMLGLLIRPLWKLQMPKAKKIGIIILLGLSSSSCIASVLRLKSALDAFPKDDDTFYDFTWTGVMDTLYAITEVLLGIICCSVPALMPIRFRLLPCFFRQDPEPLAARPPPHLPLQSPQTEQRAPILGQPDLPSGSSVELEHIKGGAQPLLPTCHSRDTLPSIDDDLSITQVGSSERSSSVDSQTTQRSMSTQKTLTTMPTVTET